MSSKAIADFLPHAEGAGPLMAQAKLLLALSRAIEPLVPAPLRPLYRVANYKQGDLLIFTANNAVAARFRLLAPGIQEACLERGTSIHALKLEVRPTAFTPVSRPGKRAFLSGNAKQALKKLENDLEEGELRARVRAIAAKS
ncbi:MAG TPA: DciA family protein [Burkholderiales bacterium]|nr:DciA family protein [Burkholderiales bacterium]